MQLQTLKYFSKVRPEVNAHQLCTGPGEASMLAAAQAWKDLSDELSVASHDIQSTVTTLTTVWQGAASDQLAQAVAPYLVWLDSVIDNTDTIANQIRTVAQAYQYAAAAMVPESVVADNIAQRETLIRNNLLGLNNPAIALAQQTYVHYKIANARAMASYADDAEDALSSVPPFAEAPMLTNDTGLAQTAVVS